MPHLTNCSSTLFFSAGKMYFVSQSINTRSSAIPRNSTIGMCVWVLIRPGMMTLPSALIVLAEECWRSTSAEVPIATMRSPRIATAPFSITRAAPSIVTTVPPRTMMSARSAAAAQKGITVATSASINMIIMKVFFKSLSPDE